MRIPSFLTHLRTDRRGIPVPYVNRWGKQENPELLVIQFDPLVSDRAVFYLDVDEPEPDFTAQVAVYLRHGRRAAVAGHGAHPPRGRGVW